MVRAGCELETIVQWDRPALVEEYAKACLENKDLVSVDEFGRQYLAQAKGKGTTKEIDLKEMELKL